MSYSMNKELHMNPDYQMFEERSLLLHGEVTPAMHARALTLLLAYKSWDPTGLITCYISGPGGSVAEGLGILDAARSTGCPLRTVVTGMAASMSATLAACLGDKGERYIMPNAELMIHQPMSSMSGQESDQEIQYMHSRKVRSRLDKLVSEATGKTVEEVHADMDRDLWLNAEEALEYGLVDHILTM